LEFGSADCRVKWHLENLQNRRKLTGYNSKKGLYEEALEMYTKSLDIKTRILGGDVFSALQDRKDEILFQRFVFGIWVSGLPCQVKLVLPFKSGNTVRLK
jgi:hypothetical protein